MRRKLHVSFIIVKLLQILTCKWTCSWSIANSAQMDENLGGKLLVQKMLLWNEFAVKY